MEISRVIKRFDQVLDDLLECISTIVDKTSNFNENDYRSLANMINRRGQTVVHSNTSLYARNFQDIDLVLDRLCKYLED